MIKKILIQKVLENIFVDVFCKYFFDMAIRYII